MVDLTRKQIAAHDHTKNNGESIPATSLNSNGIAGGKVPTSDGNGGVIWQVGGGGGVDLSEIVVIPYGPLPTMTFPYTAEGLQAACNICISSEGGLADGGQIFLPPGTISGLDLIVYDYTSIFGSGNESTYLYGRIKVGTSCAMRDFFLVNEGASTDPIYGFYGYTPDGYVTDWRNEFSNIKVRVTNTVGKAYCVYNLKESVFNSCYLKAYSEGNNIDSNPFGGTVFPLVAGIPDGWKLNNCNFDGFTHFEAVKFPEIVPEGSFTVVDLIDGKNYHSQDLYDNTPTRHLPLPTPTGMIPVSNGTSWELTPIPEPSSGVNLTVKEVDNLPSVSASTIIFPNGTLTDNGSGVVTYTPPIAGDGDVIGPASAVDGHLVVFDGATGKIVKDGGAVPTGTGGGGYTLISDVTVSVDGPVTFTDIPQTYKQLHIIGRARGSNNGTSDTLTIQVGNGSIDTGVNYSYMLRQDGSAAANNRSDTATYIAGGIISGNSDTAGYFSDIRVDINYYTDSQFKTFEVQSSTYGTAYRMSIGGGIWKSSAAINQIQIQGLALGKLETGSRISLYGL
jgi:hypothetical protein